MVPTQEKKMNTNNIGPISIYADHAEFFGISIYTDPINRTDRTEADDTLMCMMHEEQPCIWHCAYPFIAEAIAKSNGEIGFLDVGTGSGVFATLVAKHFPGQNILAIDKNPRAVKRAAENAKRNGVEFRISEEFYSEDTAPAHSCRTIGIYPPYHLYPVQYEMLVPQHARGGWDGQREFKNQLSKVGYHLADDGIIFFNQNCPGSEEGPAFLDYYQQLVGGKPSMTYTEILPRIKMHKFLEYVYEGIDRPETNEYIEMMCDLYEWNYLVNGIIRADGLGKVDTFVHDYDLKDVDWPYRAKIHNEISLVVEHQLRQQGK